MSTPETEPAKTLHAVAVEHSPEDCPLQQVTPEAALTLAENLKQNPSTGVFSMKLHHGVVLMQTDNPEELAAAIGKVLPNHLSAEVKDVSDNEHMQAVHAEPQQLDDEAARHKLLAEAHKEFPNKGFDQTEAKQLPSLPLSSDQGPALPDFLEANAPKA
jgi:hypothetical protein